MIQPQPAVHNVLLEHILLSEIQLQVVQHVKHDIIVQHEQVKQNVHEEHNIVKHERVHVV